MTRVQYNLNSGAKIAIFLKYKMYIDVKIH